jgi:hypothetical protein
MSFNSRQSICYYDQEIIRNSMLSIGRYSNVSFSSFHGDTPFCFISTSTHFGVSPFSVNPARPQSSPVEVASNRLLIICFGMKLLPGATLISSKGKGPISTCAGLDAVDSLNASDNACYPGSTPGCALTISHIPTSKGRQLRNPVSPLFPEVAGGNL